jgi:hypothetical protein
MSARVPGGKMAQAFMHSEEAEYWALAPVQFCMIAAQ